MAYILFILAVLLAVIISCSAFQQIPSTSNANAVKRSSYSSSSLGMAPRFDKTTEKWFPSDPEVCVFVLSIIYRFTYIAIDSLTIIFCISYAHWYLLNKITDRRPGSWIQSRRQSLSCRSNACYHKNYKSR